MRKALLFVVLIAACGPSIRSEKASYEEVGNTSEHAVWIPHRQRVSEPHAILH